MKKFLLGFGGDLTVKYLPLKLLHHFVIYAFVFFPGISYTSSLPQRGEIRQGIIKQPYFLETCVPCFEYFGIGAVPPDIVSENSEPVGEGSFGRSVTTVPIQY